MKSRTLALLSVTIVCRFVSSAASADVPRTIPLQGVITNAARVPLPDGAYPNISFRLYDHLTGPAQLWQETKTVTLAGGHGVFATVLGDTTTLPASVSFNRPYWVSVQVGADPEMTPRLPLQSVPYALNAWNTGGNAGTNPATQFLGTTDNQPLVLKSNGHRVLQLQDAVNATAVRSVNILLGSEANTIAADVIGGTVGGGGSATGINDLRSDFSVIGGGAGNFADAEPYIVIGGGAGNIGQSFASVIAGGQGNNTQGQLSVISGGSENYTFGTQSTVAGGTKNQATGPVSAIGGGENNIAAGFDAVVAGGNGNHANGANSFIGSGYQNVSGSYASVAGGQTNQANGLRSFIGGGNGNSTAVGYDSAIGGGQGNIANGGDAFIGAGYQNIASANDSAVAGGHFNQATGEAAFVGGGASNKATSGASTVAGGDTNAASGQYAFIGGGNKNYATGQFSMVPGGYYSAAQGIASFAAGYRAVSAQNGSFVWSDYSAEQDFGAPAINQFCIRAKGGIVVESFGDVAFYTGVGTTDAGRYVELLNSPNAPSASGLKAGGILCADSYGYGSPGKNDLVVKGKVSVGYTAATQYTLAVNGSIYALSGYSSSDRRLKTNIRSMDSALTDVMRLHGVTFDWNKAAARDRNFPDGRQIGLIAQDVEAVLPELVSEDGLGFKAVNYQGVIPVLVEALKEQQKEIDDLRSVKAENAALLSRMARLEQAMALRETSNAVNTPAAPHP